MAPLSAAQALMTSANLAAVLSAHGYKIIKHGNGHMKVNYMKRNMVQIKGLD